MGHPYRRAGAKGISRGKALFLHGFPEKHQNGERFTVNGRLSGMEEHAVRRYRYRTSVLTGPWRDTESEAANDAVRAKQAVTDAARPAGIRWTVPGKIEERASEEAPSRLRN